MACPRPDSARAVHQRAVADAEHDLTVGSRKLGAYRGADTPAERSAGVADVLLLIRTRSVAEKIMLALQAWRVLGHEQRIVVEHLLHLVAQLIGMDHALVEHLSGLCQPLRSGGRGRRNYGRPPFIADSLQPILRDE